MEFQRRDRLVEVIRAELAGILRRVKDPRLSGLLTVTGVELSRDLKTAVAFYSIYGSDENRAHSARALASAAPFIRYELKSRLRLKVIPTVRFEYDQTPERAGRVLELLTRIEQERAAAPPAPSPGVPPPSPASGRGKGEGPRPPRRKQS